ncbi:MAG: T9SS type A sorting domain-containing protein [Bacteroidetes bacterium]|nr:MAG: T9SS type A sorting domain-containing protein [Bacteroidota bacterium]
MQTYIGNFEAYPNPTDKYVTFSYELKQSALVKLELYDHMGNIIDKIFSEKQEKGNYKRVYNTYDLKEGLYYAVLWAENEYKTIGLIIMH